MFVLGLKKKKLDWVELPKNDRKILGLWFSSNLVESASSFFQSQAVSFVQVYSGFFVIVTILDEFCAEFIISAG